MAQEDGLLARRQRLLREVARHRDPPTVLRVPEVDLVRDAGEPEPPAEEEEVEEEGGAQREGAAQEDDDEERETGYGFISARARSRAWARSAAFCADLMRIP